MYLCRHHETNETLGWDIKALFHLLPNAVTDGNSHCTCVTCFNKTNRGGFDYKQ